MGWPLGLESAGGVDGQAAADRGGTLVEQGVSLAGGGEPEGFVFEEFRRW
jgi:hypothetical protein